VANSAFNCAFPPRTTSLATRQQRRTHLVQTVSLDDYCAEAGVLPDPVKIDAESAESHVLAGVSGLMTEHPPYITVEVGDDVPTGTPSSRELLDSVLGRGYTAVRATEDGLRPEPLLLAPPGSTP
jgi:hypothetical protein